MHRYALAMSIVVLVATTGPALAQYTPPVVTTSTLSAQEVELTWIWLNPYPVLGGVDVRRAESAEEIDTNFEVIATVSQTDRAFIDDTVLPGRNYWYRLAPWRFGIGGQMFRDLSAAVTASTVGYYLFTDATGAAMAQADPPTGLAWGDCDGDGYPDLYACANGGGGGGSGGAHNSLFRNLGDGNFTQDESWPLDDNYLGYGAAWADFDNDRDLDLAFVNFADFDRLFTNDGDGNFSDTDTWSISYSGPAWQLAWGDYDNDGWVDLFIMNSNDIGWSVELFRNMEGSYFSNQTPAVMEDSGPCKSAVWVDGDDDGDLDLYLTKGATIGANPNRLLRNDGGGNFTDLVGSDLAFDGHSVGQAWGDYDNDGDLDVYITQYQEPNRLMRNDGGWNFTDVAVGPLAASARSAAVAWIDYDNDGDLDLYYDIYLAGNFLLRNDGGGQFSDASSYPVNGTGLAYGAAWADYDDDGDLDLAMAYNALNVRLYRNDVGSSRNWMDIDLLGNASNAAGIGTRIRVVADGVSQIREVSGSSTRFSFHELTAHFGLGDAAAVDTLEVKWPSGIVQTFTQGLVMNRTLRIWESPHGTSGVGDVPAAETGGRLVGTWPNPFNPRTNIEYEVAEPGRVRIEVFDAKGHRVRSLLNEAVEAGRRTVSWNGQDDGGRPLASGIYYCRLELANGFVDSRSMVLVR